ncbi:aspartyl protease family protein [Sphingomonas sp. A2-49]|uniref:retropepsin-like aspartic protease n=1 Tax=Sphingomonas sp. A2-49 TaxID=1391375 RepID=UPI0021D28F5C|nr:aspartyl protease family protein [Sphingomonas sp. A2-49]MCU6453294.1 aspartyl protease family protein [Sphingomonas sp. A2-49]
MSLSQPGDFTVSRRSLIARLLGFGAAAAMGKPGLATIAPHLVGQWNFGRLPLDWQPLEVATGDTLLVKARVAGSPVEAVLDSGSGASIIDLSLAQTLGLANVERRTISGLGGKAPVRLIRDVDVLFGNRTRRLPFAVVADLSALSAAFGRRINMLLGADMFVENCIALDFGQRQFALMPTGSFPGGADWTPVALGHGAKQELYVSASIGGSSPVPLMIDLGSSAALMLSSTYVDAHGLTRGRATSTAALGGVEGVATVDVFTTPKLSIGGLSAENIPTLGNRNWLPTSTVGNIGLPLIGQFDAIFDVTAGFVWLRPPASGHRLPMLKDRSGLGLTASPMGLDVVHVAANSPAAKDGWTAGNRIVAVNGFPIDADYTHGARWRWRFMPPGTVIKIKDQAGRDRQLKLADYY